MDKMNMYIRSGFFVSLIAVILFSLVFNLHAQKEDPAKAEERRLTREAQMAMVSAQELRNNEQYAQAIAEINKYLSTGPEFITEIMYLMLGQLWDIDGKPREALKVFEEAYGEYPQSESIILSYAKALVDTESFSKAGPIFEKIYEMKKEISFLVNAAGSYYWAEMFDDSKRVYISLIRMTDKPEQSWFDNVIMIAQQQNNMKEAEKYIFEALNVYPAEKKYWQSLANIRQFHEDYRGMTSAFEIVVNIEPYKTKREWDQLVQLYTYLGVPTRAAEKLKKAIAVEKPTDDDHIRIAKAYERAMRIDEAVKYLDQVIAREGSTGLMLEKIKILYNDRRNQEVIEAVNELIKINPREYEAYMMKGWAAWDMKDWRTSREAFVRLQDSRDFAPLARNAIDVLDNLEEARTADEYKPQRN